MTSTGSVEQITPSTYLLTIVATVIAATKCKLVGGSRRRPQRSFAARPMCRELCMQRIHKTCQANCVTFRGVYAQRPQQVASSVECVRRYGNRCAAPTSRKADLLSPAVRYSWARFLTMPSATFADQGPASSRVEPSRRVRRPQAASSIARIAVSGWLMGSTPTRLTIEVIVPSASASTQAARCSSPRYGSPGSSTHPDAAPLHSGNDGVVSEGGCSINSAGG